MIFTTYCATPKRYYPPFINYLFNSTWSDNNTSVFIDLVNFLHAIPDSSASVLKAEDHSDKCYSITWRDNVPYVNVYTSGFEDGNELRDSLLEQVPNATPGRAHIGGTRLRVITIPLTSLIAQAIVYIIGGPDA